MAENVSIVIKAFDKTKPAFGAVTKALTGVTSAVFSMRTALTGAAGLAGFAYLIKSSLNATDTLSKTANKIGTTTEALGGLRYAAEITGVATNTMDMALQRFTRRTAEAAKGMGEAKGAIKELGLNAQELNKMPLDQRMIALADAFGKVNNESDQLRLAFKLFDSEGAALVNTLALGSDGLKDLLGEAKLLGLTMSTTAAQGVEKANDSITKLLSLGKGLKDQFSAALAPAIDSAVTMLTKFFQAIAADKGGVEKWARGMAKGFLQSIQDIIKGLDTGLSAISEFANKANLYINAIEIRSQENNIKRFNKEIKGLSAEIEALESGGKQSFTDYLLGDDIDSKKDKLEDLMHRSILAGQAVQDLSKPISGNNLGEFFDTTIAKIEAMKNAIGVDAGGTSSLFEPVINELGDLRQGFKDWSDLLPDTTSNIKSLTNQGLNGLTDALTAGITGAANFADAMKSMAKSVVDSLIKMLIQKYIVDAAFGAITGFIGGSARMATGATGTMSGPASNYFVPSMSGKAIGGSVQSGQPYMVGERGPEMFVPNSQGSIVPNGRSSGGGVVVNQTINVTTGVQQTVRAEIASLMPQIANAAKGAVADAKMRGGNYSKMLGA
jgi:uncharacterized protein YoxC